MTSTGSASTTVNTDVLVDGMTCSHCVMSVTEELSEIDGVQAVTVDLHAGETSAVTIVSSAPLAAASIRTAVEEAGYSLASSTADGNTVGGAA